VSRILQNTPMTIQPVITNIAVILAFFLSSGISLSAQTNDCSAVGGFLITLVTDTTEVTVCVGDEISDAVYAQVWEEEGDGSIYITTDADGNILNTSNGPKFQFEGTPIGTNFIYHVSTVGDVAGIVVGSNISNISGCHQLSNGIRVNKVDEGDQCGCAMIVSLGKPTAICLGEEITLDAEVFNSNVCTFVCEVDNSRTLVEWNMDACHSISDGVENKDFSELAPSFPDENPCVGVTATHVNVEGGMHSCTVPQEGLGGRAMCFSGSKKCYWRDDSPDALRFSVTVDPAQSSTIQGLQFYESAPERFTWYNPDFSEDVEEGPNNFPRFYGLRVTKNGEEIFQENDIPTSQDWTLEEFDFSGNDAFRVQETTTFEFELLAYCPAWRNAITYAWDLDNIRLTGGCCEKDTVITGVDYIWSTGDTGESITVSPTEDAEYSVTVTDCMGCVATTRLPVLVKNPVTADLGNDINVCSDNLPLTLTHSTEGIETKHPRVEWSTGEVGESIEVSEPGTYTVTVTDGLACSDVDEIIVSISDPEQINLPDNIDPVCAESTLNLSTLEPSGSTGGVWTNGAGEVVTSVGQGTYTYTFTDGDGCVVSDQVTITEDNFNFSIDDQGPICPEDNFNFDTIVPDGVVGDSWTVEDLGGGRYRFSGTNANGCTATTEFNILIDDFTINLPAPPVLCQGEEFMLSTQEPSQYPGGIWTDSNGNVAESADAGTFTYTVSNDNGCSASDDITFELSDFVMMQIADDTVCWGDSILLSSLEFPSQSGGFWKDLNNEVVTYGKHDTRYRYHFFDTEDGCTGIVDVRIHEKDCPDPCEGYTVPVGDAPSICPGDSILLSTLEIDGFTGGIWKDLNSEAVSYGMIGTYTYNFFEDENGCAATIEVDIDHDGDGCQQVDPCEGFGVSVINPQAICADENITLNILEQDGSSGGTWTNANGEEVSSGGAGSYTYTLTNSDGCTASTQVTVTTIDCTDPCDGFSVSFTNPDVICNDATFDLSTLVPAAAAGGTWSDADGNSVSSVGPGTYTYSVTTDAGCSASADVTITGEDCSDPCANHIPMLDLGDDITICSSDAPYIYVPNLTCEETISYSSGNSGNISFSGDTLIVSGSASVDVVITGPDGETAEDNILVIIENCPPPDPCADFVASVPDLGEDREVCQSDLPILIPLDMDECIKGVVLGKVGDVELLDDDRTLSITGAADFSVQLIDVNDNTTAEATLVITVIDCTDPVTTPCDDGNPNTENDIQIDDCNCCGTPIAGQVIYVDTDATGANNGSSWTDAYTDLQDAMGTALSGQEIWVADGTYMPAQDGNREAHFNIPSGVDLYGGFSGNEENICQRDFTATRTILSGDLAGNDKAHSTNLFPLELLFEGTEENSFYVLRNSQVTDDIKINGVAITGGVAQGSDTAGGGGMLFVNDSDATIELTNVLVVQNQGVGLGGGVRINTRSETTFTVKMDRVIFLQNRVQGPALSKGGGLFFGGWNGGFIDAEITNCVFAQNYAQNRGGAINNDDNVNVNYTNCLFAGNRSSDGGAVFENNGTNEAIHTNNTFYLNHADIAGGAIVNFADFGSNTIENRNCIFFGNVAIANAGPALDNFGRANDNFAIQNCLFSEIDIAAIEAEATNTDDRGGNQFNIADPMFTDPLGADFSLQSSSPAVNAGDNSFVTLSEDLAGSERIQDGTVDMGALESGEGGVCFTNIFDLAGAGFTQPEYIAEEFLVDEEEEIEVYKAPQIVTYPNPASDIISVKINKSEEEEVSLKLFDISGNGLATNYKMVNDFGEQVEYALPVKDFRGGVYILRAKVGRYTLNKRVIVIK